MSGSSAKNYLQNGDIWVVGGDGSGVDIPDGSITTAKIASKAITDDKLRTAGIMGT